MIGGDGNGAGLHLFAVQFVIHVAVDALGYHNRQGHGLVLLELLAVGVFEALDEAEAIAILYTRAAPNLGSILLETFVAELLETRLNRVLGGAETTGCDRGVLAFTDKNETATGSRCDDRSNSHMRHGSSACSSGNGSSSR